MLTFIVLYDRELLLARHVERMEETPLSIYLAGTGP
jgi:hypothetical protein